MEAVKVFNTEACLSDRFAYTGHLISPTNEPNIGLND